jgi:hypothetical protein
VVGSLLHGVIDFSRCCLWRRLVGSLVHFSLRLEEYGVVFGVMIGLITIKHAIRRSECVWALATTAVMTWCAASLIVLSEF